MAKRWKRTLILAAAVLFVLAVCPTLRYTTLWQLKAIRQGALPPALPSPRELRPEVIVSFGSSNVGQFIAPRLEDMAQALKKHPRDWRLAAGVASLAEALPMPVDHPSRIIVPDLRRDAFEKAIDARPDLAPLRGWAAAAYLSQGASVRTRPGQVSPDTGHYSETWEVRLEKPQYLALAKKHLREAVALEPRNAFYEQLFSCLWVLKAQPERAMASLERALNKPVWTTHGEDIPELAEYAIVMSGTDPLAARLLRGNAQPWDAHGPFILNRQLGLLAWNAMKAGDHDQAIRIYRVLLGLASKIRQSSPSLQELMWLRDVARAPAIGPFRVEDLEPMSDPRIRALPETVRYRTMLRRLDQGWYDYLEGQGYGNLATFAMAEHELLDSAWADVREHRMPEPGPPLDLGARIWAVQTWVTAALLLAALALAILWGARLLPAQSRRRITLALDRALPSSLGFRLAIVLLAVLPLLAFAVWAYRASSQMLERPQLLVICLGAAFFVLVLEMLLASALVSLWQRPSEVGVLADLLVVFRGGTLWLAYVFLMLWLVLSVPVYISARVGLHRLAALERIENNIRLAVPHVTLRMPPVPGPDPPAAPPR